MDFIDHLINYFRKPKEETKNTSPEGTCPVCWGRQEYDGKIRQLFKDKQIDVNHHEDSYLKSKKFVVEHIDGIRYKKGEIQECPTCGKTPNKTNSIMKGYKTKRVYDEPANNDGYRLLIDRIWPRGVSKEDAKLDEWDKDLAPSTELRKWFDHDPKKFEEFTMRYKKELKKQEDELKRIKKIAKDKQVCLLYGAKDEKHNQAVVLKAVLEDS